MNTNNGINGDSHEELWSSNKRLIYSCDNENDTSPSKIKTSHDSLPSASSDISRSKNSNDSHDSHELKNDIVNEIYEQLNNQTKKFNSCDFLYVKFQKQPPHNLRKSNFFNFEISFHDKNWNQYYISSCNFAGFVEDIEDKQVINNGLKYRFVFMNKDGSTFSHEIHIHLVDSITYNMIKYEGTDKNPDMCRVLLTHEVMCSRCCDKKSCGNKNETPSDPVAIDNAVARLYMKCNQNCLKNAGNPKDIRRFLIMISTINEGERLDLAYSQSMFVHNNSKHGRKNNLTLEASLSKPAFYGMPSIKFVIPNEGSSNGGYYVALIGENFFQGINIAFGNFMIWDIEVISSTVLRVLVPPSSVTGPIEISCIYNSRKFQYGQSCIFSYIENMDYIDNIIQRMSRFIPRMPNDADVVTKASILKRAADLLEFTFMLNNGMSNSSLNNLQLFPDPSIGLNFNNLPMMNNHSIRKNNLQSNDILNKNSFQSLTNGYANNYLDGLAIGIHDLNNNTQLYTNGRTNLHAKNFP